MAVMALVYVLVGLIALVASVFWIIALIDCLGRQFAEPMDKLIWVLVILFTHGLGALIYWFVGRPQGRG